MGPALVNHIPNFPEPLCLKIIYEMKTTGMLQLPHLTLFPQISELDLSACSQLNDDWLPLIAFNTQLKSLNLAGYFVSKLLIILIRL